MFESSIQSRRSLIHGFAVFTGLSAAAPLLFARQMNQTPQPIPSPNAPNPRFPNGMNGPNPTGPDQKAIDKSQAAQLRTDVDKLFALVTDLRQEVSLTSNADVLSLSVLKKAKEIEKLAKQVKDLAHG
jgi:hypothetical protein